VIRWPWNRRKSAPCSAPKRVLRIVLDVDGAPHFDISDKLARSMIDCHYGRPVQHEFVIPDPLGARHVVRLTLSEVES